MTVLTAFLPMLLAWLARRALELGGVLLAIGSVNPEALQALILTVAALLTGNWDQVSLGALVGIIGTIGGLIWNGRTTFRPQIVTSDHKRFSVPTLTEEQVRAMTGYQGQIERR